LSKTKAYGELASKYILGGARTYRKGDDQWPENTPRVIERGKGFYAWFPMAISLSIGR
jgi:hypothetical protein